MGVNTALWWPITILGILAWVNIEVTRRLSLRRAGAVLEAVTSILAVLFALGAGSFVPRTFVGQDVLPALLDIDPAMRIVVSAVAFIGVCAGVLAFVPAWWSSTVAAGPPIILAITLIPVALSHSYGGGAMDLARTVVDLGAAPAGALVDWAVR